MSRLDKLLDLIETAPTPAARRAAALQLGEIINSKPEEIGRLLTRLYPYTIHKKFETRTAAGIAVEAMAKNVPVVRCAPLKEPWTFETFNLDEIMKTHKVLLAMDDSKQKAQPVEIVSSSKLSTRQKLMMKRKAKKAQEKETEVIETTEKLDFNCDGWPFELFCEKMMQNIFDPKWEIRHGAAICLREVLRAQSNAVGKEWRIDLTLKLLSVISLDRFGDFISDTVIAPVRDTCAQVIGIAIRNLGDEVSKFIKIICQMYHKDEWEVKHGALLVLKYTVAIVDKKQIQSIFIMIKPILIEALTDVGHDESVAVAAEVMRELVDFMKSDFELIQKIRSLLWDVLEDLDELTASTNNVLQLLECVDRIAAEQAPIPITILIDQYIPKLLPFSGHVLPSVRTAVMETYHSVLSQILSQLTAALPHQPKIPPTGKSLEKLFFQCCAAVVSEANDYLPTIDDLLNEPVDNPIPHNNRLLHHAVANAGLLIMIITHAFPETINNIVKELPKLLRVFELGSEGKIDKKVVSVISKVKRDAPIAEQKERIDILFNGGTIVARIIEAARKVGNDAENCVLQSLNSPQSIMLAALATEFEETHSPLVRTKLEEIYSNYQYDDFNSFDWKMIVETYKENSAGLNLPLINNSRELIQILPKLRELVPNKISKLEHSLKTYNEMVQGVICRTKAIVIGAIYPSVRDPTLLHEPILREYSPLLTEHFTMLFHRLYQNTTDTQSLGFLFATLIDHLKPMYSNIIELINNEQITFYNLTLPYSLHYFLKFLAQNIEYKHYLLSILTPLLVEPPPDDPTTSLYYPLSISVLPFLPTCPLHVDHIKTLLKNVHSSHAFLIATTLSRLLRLHKELLTTFITLIYPQLSVTSPTLLAALHIFHHMCLSPTMATLLIPVFPLLITPFLGVMNSNHESNIRRLGAQCFSVVLRYLPLHVTPPPDLPDKLRDEIEQKKIFISFLFDGIRSQSISQFSVFNHPINGKLRPYQLDGISWLLFLHKYCINGILCDDMGLGKTLQTLCLLVTVHKEAEYPSLIVCPPTLTGHWKHEIEQFISQSDLKGVLYTGSVKERFVVLNSLRKKDILIASYEMVRHDLEQFKTKRFTYCVLDEGHIIKNPKTKLTQAVKQIISLHRLILTGTPIQNNVLELWSLFDFLMPGFLGTEKEFSERYSKPILAAKDAASPEDQERGVIVMEKLHRQVLPFILRRLKESVLQDLPPKIIQDYYCDMSPVQRMLYQEFESTNDMDEIVQQKSDKKQKNHIFQILNYFRRLCVHPMLVLDDQHPMKQKVDAYLKQEGKTIDDITNSPKLMALAELLEMCNIGKDGEHRVLIFAQMNITLELIEKQLFAKQFPYISYYRLDGSVPQNKRTEIVDKFKNDPTIDVLLLTTRVGGLGLNLTAADIVIFMEHDWNPTKDLQAMDRAHRLGQNKVVNVYRLIVRQTLEERIMNLQQFKTKIANTVVTRENETFAGMNAGNFVELFNKEGEEKKPEKKPEKGISSLLESLGDWDEEEYGDEFDLNAFVDKTNQS
ncbi:SNF2 family protein [Entamoeba histolytica HM-1:IMSS-B]|uniref:SNF2 family protein n=4 Tax=Entamoeba histolytica TaxID=5759 RepID=C4LUU5_ENTH1|nr:SNF2 family protein [Entamoeba histolytica HM-1:IMSS]EAL50858.1 SNF2 family protein [Entamoeba histolytica HM-1:IMSS]EMH72752.1 SNF2 family protein [Entamoeba histolytica HM-1:IMSS-B]ENY61453.1 SNF2 family protein, putative [Entamoeba histolytica HM-1:IMSS-A]GAT92405.1 snf2 family protein [Entamoeba histolytica]|eukprot:XP_656243.1 SNF2 family protein [Entamoeba histolytica HM-1:IMSS]